MLYKYSDMLAKYGSAYQVAKAVGELGFDRVAPGLYSSEPNPSPSAVICARYPQVILTMDSAFYLHGLTDTIPNVIHVASPRNSTRIRKAGVRQYFMEKGLMAAGVKVMETDGAQVRVFSRERMLVELLRSSAKLPPDYYHELVGSYRRVAPELDMREVEDALDLYKRADGLFDKLQREIL